MEITVAKNSGFCPGVRRAVDRVHALLADRDENTGICILGQLIHNPQIIAELEEKGVRTLGAEDEDAVREVFEETKNGRKTVAVIRTHGTTKRMSDLLYSLADRNPDFTVLDLTCPFVKKIHTIVSEHPGEDLTVFGDPDHPEVRGIVSRGSGGIRVISSADELEEGKIVEKPTVLVSQTTQKLTEWKICQNKFRFLYTNAKIFDTICNVTEERQRAAEELSKTVDVMIVIGGRGSSNTKQLAVTAEKYCARTYFIESPAEAKTIPLTGNEKIGITAGASTPYSNIEEVQTIMTTIDEAITPVAEGDKNFAELLEESFKTLNNGDIVRGVIVSIGQTELHVDLGAKVTGVVAFDEITDDSSAKLSEMFKVGDEIDVKVLKVSDRDGIATLSKKSVDGIAKWREIMAAAENGTVLEGTVTEAVKGGVILAVDGQKLFVPASQTGIPKEGDLNVLVGTTQRVKVIDTDEKRRRAVASIRVVAREERKEREAKFWEEIEIGKFYTGTVKSMTSYGAFVDLGGVDGMVHSTELSWKRIKNPAEVVSIGETITVFVKDFDKEAKRISLGYKTEETNPWNVFINKYQLGDVAEVKVVSLMTYGAFAEVVPGTDGLIHISQIADRKIDKPSDVLEVGQVVNAKIVSIDTDKHQIGLSIRALLEDNAEEEAETEENA
ncbi:MAG: bifunctional 4-hydroxy-3-methylbut-2-enyl diphosphate reductase/30S ribosomal protein S1 [Lachnospiraceae bacterium]|nr:bifunctional 4-hydroxy-3-methylbut-2-enyl diphosphate reductase/30S ribosomal protein S1 [Lachnospiraceae bacterium]